MFDEYERHTWAGEGISPMQTAFATNRRVPFLSASHTRWPYVAGIVVGGTALDNGIEPLDFEVALIGDLLERTRATLAPGFLRAMEQFAPYDIDDSGVGLRFLKRADGGWAYLRTSWTAGPPWAPANDAKPATLAEVISRAAEMSLGIPAV